jgi:hypothetical protein
MLTSRRLSVLALFGAIAQCAVAGPSLALPGSEPVAASGPVLLQLVARRGTRNYMTDDTTPLDTSPAATDAASEAKALEDCIAIWDAGTHITKSKWREICQRQLKERGAQLSGH